MEALITLSGYVGTDIDFRQGEGWSMARFRLGSTPRIQRKGEWTDGETTWISVRTTNRTAENVRDSISKGEPVIVVGRLRTNVWTDDAGERHDKLVIEATTVGHDLSRGTSAFSRPQHAELEGEAEAA